MEHASHTRESLHALEDIKDIRSMMERSTRFLSLSGWSGVWAGAVALVSACIAWSIIGPAPSYERQSLTTSNIIDRYNDPLVFRLALLAILTFIIAFCGAYYFTWRKAASSGRKMWTHAARQLMWHIMLPLIVGGFFCLAFLLHGHYNFIAPACLGFYGLALVNGSKYTLGEIRWLGYLELVLACIALFVSGFGLGFMALGFGLLHILYGIVMWNKHP